MHQFTFKFPGHLVVSDQFLELRLRPRIASLPSQLFEHKYHEAAVRFGVEQQRHLQNLDKDVCKEELDACQQALLSIFYFRSF